MDWKKVIRDLENSGMTQVEISEAVSCTQPTVSDLKSGKRGQRLSFDIGIKLVELHKKKLAQKAKKQT